MDSLAQPLVKSPTLDLSQDTLTQKTAENTTFALKVLPANMDAQSEQSSRSETQTVQETAKTPKMFPDGKFLFKCYPFLFPHEHSKPIKLLLMTVLRIDSQMLNSSYNLYHFHTSNHKHKFSPTITATRNTT